jgi:VWFA-related protein
MAALAGAAAAQPAGAQAPPPVFRASVEAAYVDVFVSRDGQPIAGLQASNFELKDNGVRQELELVAAESRPLSTLLVFDTSSSVQGDRLAALRAAGEAFLSGLRPADEAALVTFSEEISSLAPATADRASVRAALASLRAEGTTAVLDALYAAVALSEEAGSALIVLFTDGEDNLSFLSEEQLTTAVARSNALVHVVGWVDSAGAAPLGTPPLLGTPRLTSADLPEPDHRRALRKIAEASGGRFWAATSAERLRSAFAEIADAMGHRYVLRYQPRGVKREGWHRIEVDLVDRKGDVQARHGYWVGTGAGR